MRIQAPLFFLKRHALMLVWTAVAGLIVIAEAQHEKLEKLDAKVDRLQHEMLRSEPGVPAGGLLFSPSISRGEIREAVERSNALTQKMMKDANASKTAVMP